MFISLAWVGLSFLVAFMGMNRKFGFWGYFFGSLLLTPVVGLLLVLASDKRSARVSAPKLQPGK